MNLKQKSLPVFIFLLALCHSGLAQQSEFPLIFSGKILDTVATLQEEKKYDEALRYAYRVPENDTNYRQVVYQLAYTHLLAGKYDSCVFYARSGAALFPEGDLQFLHLAVSAYDYADSTAAALTLVNQLIGKYPNFPHLYHSRGAIYSKLNREDEAVADFQQAILINPFFSSAHFGLGERYYKKGDLVSALLAFQSYLLLAPEGKYVSATIKYLSNYTTITDEVQELASGAVFSDNPSFETIQQVLLSTAAFSKKYQLRVSLDDNIIRQMQACNELLKFEAGNPHFVMQYYVPFFTKTFADGDFEVLVFSMLSGLTLKEVKAWLAKNEKRTTDFGGKAFDYFNDIRVSRELFFEKRKAASVCYLWEDGALTGYGPCSNLDLSVYSGQWKLFHANGVVSGEGMFSKQQEREGQWKFYYENGQLKEQTNYKAGKPEGSISTWHRNGNLSMAYEVKNGLQEGPERNYFYNGQLRNEAMYRNGKKNGRETEYNYKGYKIAEVNCTDDEYDGLLVNFYENGRAKDSLVYKMGMPEGRYVKYSPEGTLMEKGWYANGKRNGEWTLWYNDSVRSGLNNYLNGENTGEFAEYHKNGTVSRKGRYLKGEIDGMIEDYDDDGKMYAQIEMDKGRVRNISFFDKSGNKTQTYSTAKGSIGITFFDPHGNRLSAGNFSKDGLKQGEFTDYFANGKVSGKTGYTDNLLDGLSTAWHVNGQKKYETVYAANEINGLNTWYYPNGNKSSAGWFQKGVKQQHTAFYDEKGNLGNLDYYLNGEAHGNNLNYFPNGKVQFRHQYYNGWIQKIWQYDSLGNQLAYFDLTSGKGEVVFKYMSGADYVRQTYDKFMLQGDYKIYFPDGSVQASRTYVRDAFHGHSVWYYPFGKTEEEGQFALGQKTGEWKSYHPNGNLSVTEHFAGGEQDGEMRSYRTDGSLSKVEHFQKGIRHGETTWYGNTNDVLIKLRYSDGELAGYSYPDASGKMKEEIAVNKQTTRVKAFYANGTVSVEFDLLEGEMHGSFRVNYPDGKPMHTAVYEAGLLQGARITYYPDGSVWSSDHFVANARFGPRTVFHKNGKPLMQEMFNAGVLHGECSYYDGEGKLLTTYFYYDGVPEKKIK